MSKFDELKGSLQAMYDEAIKEREALKKRQEEIEETIKMLGPVYGTGAKKKFSLENLKAAEDKQPRRAAKVAKKADKAEKADKAVAKKADVKKAPDTKKVRIKEERIHASIVKLLTDVHPKSMSAGEIFDQMKKEGFPGTDSFRTRVYGKLGDWVKEGMLIRPARGVYQIVKK